VKTSRLYGGNGNLPFIRSSRAFGNNALPTEVTPASSRRMIHTMRLSYGQIAVGYTSDPDSSL